MYTALLTRSPREQDLRRGRGRGEPEAEQKLFPALEQLDRHDRLVLLGDPGSGKSTFASFVALCLAGEALGKPDVNLERLRAPLPDDDGNDSDRPQRWTREALLPVPVVLRDFAVTGLPALGEPASAKYLWDFIVQDLKEAALEDYAGHVKNELQKRGGLLLLDGLDEVPEAERRREQVKQAVEGFVQSFPECRVLVTSRTYAYQNQDWRLGGFQQAELAPFSDGQIRRFVRRWYEHAAVIGRLSAEDARGRAGLLEQAIFSRPALRDLARRPLLLTLMASLHAWRGGDLPEERERLYADALDLLLNLWEQRRLRRDARGSYVLLQPSLAEYLKVDRGKVRAVLETLAFEAHRDQPDLAGTADLSEDRLVGALMREGANPAANPALLVEYLRERAGLLHPRGVGVYTFPHRSFQEYLAACHLTAEGYPEIMANLGRADPDRWREVALLAGAKAARGTPASLWLLVDALCYRDPGDPETAQPDHWGAQIAGQLLSETADLTRVSEANRPKLERVRRWLLHLMRSDRLPAFERALAGDNLADLGDPRFDPEHWYLSAEPMFGFVEVPTGTFRMGSERQRNTGTYRYELPQHEVSLPHYFMARWPSSGLRGGERLRALQPGLPEGARQPSRRARHLGRRAGIRGVARRAPTTDGSRAARLGPFACGAGARVLGRTGPGNAGGGAPFRGGVGKSSTRHRRAPLPLGRRPRPGAGQLF